MFPLCIIFNTRKQYVKGIYADTSVTETLLQVNLDSQAEMAHPAVPVVKEREVTLVSRDPQESARDQWLTRETKEILDYQVQLKTPSLLSEDSLKI